MAKVWRRIALVSILIFPAAIAMMGQDAHSSPNDLEIICVIDSVTSDLQNNLIVVPVYVTNFTDSIYGFQMWVHLSEPSLIKFKVTQVIGDSIYHADFDTSGTVLSGWEYMQARVLDDTTGAVINIVGTADNGVPPIHPPIPPGSALFLKLLLETKGTLGDSLCDSAVVGLILNKTQTRFSDTKGELIGYSCTTLAIDTVYENCAEWVGEVCVSWFDTTYMPQLSCFPDSSKLIYQDGKVGFSCCRCGDADGNGLLTIGDAVYIITHIFGGGPAPNPPCLGDADNNGLVTIGDAVFLITHIFGGGPAPGTNC